LKNDKWILQVNTTINHHHNRFMAFFRDDPGEPVPAENFWTLWCKGRLTEADTLTIRLGCVQCFVTVGWVAGMASSL